METKIMIDSSLCKKCRICTEICPNVIFHTDTNDTIIRSERIGLCFKCGQCMAACPEKAIQVAGLDYTRDFFDLPETIDSFKTLIQSRRSVRAFKNVSVPDEILEQIVDAITYAPPSFPPLKTEITVIRDRKLIKEALPHMVSMYEHLLKAITNPVSRFIIKRKIGNRKYMMIQNHIKPLFNIKLPYIKEGTEDGITRNAQALILLHADKNSDNYTTDIFIAVAFAILRAHSLGIGATAIDLIPPAVERTPYLRKLFKIPEGNEVVASVILGYPKFKYKRAVVRSLKSITWI